jgi:hypothetical protein
MILFKGTIDSISKVFAYYISENIQNNEECGRFFMTPDMEKLMLYPFKYLFYFIGATLAVKKFINHCIPTSVDVASIFMINIPTFTCKNK